MTKGKSLKETQIQAIKALSSGRTRAESAKDAGCGERTLYRWLSNKDFKDAVEEAQQAHWNAVLAGLGHASIDAVRYLSDVVRGVQEGNGHRVKSASTLLGAAFNLMRWKELDQIKARLVELEGGDGGSGDDQ